MADISRFGDGEIDLIFNELRKAEAKHPGWPKDPVYGAAIVSEEAGELVKAANDYAHEDVIRADVNRAKMRLEAAHVAAVAIRFLLGLK
jgi:NTP pyrophosphatase (non-canonical NTP hydrolase)